MSEHIKKYILYIHSFMIPSLGEYLNTEGMSLLT